MKSNLPPTTKSTSSGKTTFKKGTQASPQDPVLHHTQQPMTFCHFSPHLIKHTERLKQLWQRIQPLKRLKTSIFSHPCLFSFCTGQAAYSPDLHSYSSGINRLSYMHIHPRTNSANYRPHPRLYLRTWQRGKAHNIPPHKLKAQLLCVCKITY